VKYVLLAVLLAAGAVSVRWSDRLVEVEPFKTAITLRFERSWPFTAWAVATAAASAVVFKSFCRYLCPLGAFVALAGRLRRWDWLARRPECGAPCQLCRNRCEYQAIEDDGRIHYAECFQCMECVAIHDDPAVCVPLVLAARGRAIAAERPPVREVRPS
jgi:NosR/NirI family nitrous oxide reductase transcriptional regulator